MALQRDDAVNQLASAAEELWHLQRQGLRRGDSVHRWGDGSHSGTELGEGGSESERLLAALEEALAERKARDDLALTVLQVHPHVGYRDYNLHMYVCMYTHVCRVKEPHPVRGILPEVSKKFQ